MDAVTASHPSLELAASLDAREITELAETYRSWRDVLAAAMDAVVHVEGTCLPYGLARQLRECLAQAGPVPATDLEDAAMALWLHAAADGCGVQDATVSLLREPWRVFNATRTAGHLRLAG